jgi:hypothetical protein
VATAAELSPEGIALDSAGNIYISDSYQGSVSYNSIRKIDVATSAMKFGSPSPGTVSVDSPKTAVMTNIGNAELIFVRPINSFNPAVSNPDFQFAGPITCPLLDPTTNSFYLDSGESCTYSLQFKPTALGAVIGTATISDTTAINGNGGNTSGLTAKLQVIDLTGGSETGGGGGSSGPPGDFTISANPSVQKLTQNSTAIYAVSIQSTGGFFGSVTLSIAGVPSGVVYSLSPINVNVSANGTASATLTITPASGTALSTEKRRPFPGKQAPSELALLLPVSLLGITGLRKRLRRLPKVIFLLPLIFVSLAATSGLCGCADIGLEVNTQTYNMSVTGVSGGLKHSMNVKVTLQNVIPVK